MNLKTFFEHFDTLAEAPNGIQRLRELILDMAVRGKLVPQDPKDLTGQETFEKLLKEKADLAKEKRIRAGKKQPSVENDEISIEIPESWKWVRLDDIGNWGAGATPLRSNGDYYGGDNFWFKSGELPDGYLDGPSSETITELALKECSLRLNQPGDVLIAMYGATIGKLAILQVPATTNQAVCACTCFSSVYNRYLFTFLLAWRKNFAVMGAGAAQPNISRIKIIQTPFPLPPLAEQKRIVAKVDELMALCDALEAVQQTRNTLRQRLRASALDGLMNAPSDAELETAWAFVRDNWGLMCDRAEDVEGLRQVVLQVAVQGRLGTQNKSDENVSALLTQIGTTKKKLIKEGKLKNSKDKRTIEDENRPFNIPDGWAWAKINDFYDVSGGIQKTPQRRPVKNFFPYLRVANVQRNALDLGEIEYFELLDGELERWKLEKGDLLIIEGNGSAKEIGRCAVWYGEIENCVHQNHIIRARPLGHDGQLFTLTFLNSPSGMAEMKRLAITTSGLYSLSVGKIREIVIPLPPLAEQKRIVAKVDELMKLCDQLEDSLRQQQQKAQALAASAISHLAA